MAHGLTIGRRTFGGLVASGLAASMIGGGQAAAASPDGAGAVNDMLAALQAAKSLSFATQATFGASVFKDKLKTLGSRADVVFKRPDTVFAVFGAGGEPDVQLLISAGEATVLRLSLASKTSLKLDPEAGAAFMVPGLFIPFLGLLADDPKTAFFGGINSTTAIAQGLPDQPEQTSLAAVLGGQFTGEVWVDRSKGLPTRINGTWFGSRGDVAASAAIEFSDWSPGMPAEGALALKGAADAKNVDLEALGL